MLASNGAAEAAAEFDLQASQPHTWRARTEMAKSKWQADQEMATELAWSKRNRAEKEQEFAIPFPW